MKNDDVGQESTLFLMACTVSSEFGFAKHSLSYGCHQSLNVPLNFASRELQLSMFGGSVAVVLF